VTPEGSLPLRRDPRLPTRALSGWGRCLVETCSVARPTDVGRLAELVAGGRSDPDREPGPPDWIPRGLGRAYGDSSLNAGGGVLDLTRLDRLLAFDPETGVLECEAGVSLADVIATFLPRGFFLHTSPGTKHVTVGGAIAADVHGKNHHHDGSFRACVRSLRLLLADGSLVECSPAERGDLFDATVGGMGLTGVIVSARIRLRRQPTAYYRVRYRRTTNLDAALEAFAESDASYRYSVAWIDCLARGAHLGRSVLMLGRDAEVADLPPARRAEPLRVAPVWRPSVPVPLPGVALNPLTVRAFNAAFWARHRDGERTEDFDRYWYPLDRVGGWNRIYGARGFVQYQAWLPRASSRAGLVELLEAISASRRASFLAVLKACGPANASPLSYLDTGHTLALDLPYGDDVPALFDRLDAILLRHGGRLYLAKDALTSPERFAAMYPRLEAWRKVKEAVDPGRRFASSQARRLGLVEAR
jgi:decaprenylphospho-beta-D-ribofuranose 2-oxidase